jgi:hypothetical protein
MIAFPFHRLFILVSFTAMCGIASLVRAEQPPVVAAGPESKNPPAPRLKPQVIYHLPPASNYAAALHSQAKTQRDALPVDSNMPASLQMAHGAANEAAVKAQQDPASPHRNIKESAKSPAPRMVKPQIRVQQPAKHGKGQGPGKPHGNKGHRK